MDLKHSMAAIAIHLTWLFLVSLAGAAPMDTERSVEELKLMTTPELAGEARRTCRGVLASLHSMEGFDDMECPRIMSTDLDDLSCKI